MKDDYNYQYSLPQVIHFILKCWENVLFEHYSQLLQTGQNPQMVLANAGDLIAVDKPGEDDERQLSGEPSKAEPRLSFKRGLKGD